jgi:pyruvate formate lyase activating enzyme
MLKAAMLYESVDEKMVHCMLCNHECRIANSKFGVCGVRQNIKGKLYTYAYGEVVAAHIDPIEKKPLYHFLPGTRSFSIAAAGCNFKCGFCQNWQISQVSKRTNPELTGYVLPPEEIVRKAMDDGCRSISYTYTEPTIFFEYAYDTASLAREKGLLNVFVTNGFMTTKALETIQPFLDACNVDLKSFSEPFYKSVCHGALAPVLESIRAMNRLGIWVEVTTLIIPNSNDSPEELTKIARFLAEVDPDIPWHISRFHPDYQFNDHRSTPIETIRMAYQIGKQEGLRYIYMGNVPREASDTACPKCGEVLIQRAGFSVEENRVKNGRCPACKGAIAGRF